MKKRLKLFSTIASLCLAVALMAFGVWAATTATVNVTSSVSYTVTGQINMQFDISVEYIANNVKVANRDTGTKKTEDVTEGNEVYTWSATCVPGEANKTVSLALGDYTFNENAVEGNTIVYKVKITNNASEKLSVKVTGLEAIAGENQIVSLTLNKNNLTAAEEVDASGTYELIATFKLEDGTKSLTKALDFKPIFELSAVKN